MAKTHASARKAASRQSRTKVQHEALKARRRKVFAILKERLDVEKDQEIAQQLGLNNSRFSSICGGHTNLSLQVVQEMQRLWGSFDLDFSVFLDPNTPNTEIPPCGTVAVDFLQRQGLTLIVLRAPRGTGYIITGTLGVKKTKTVFAVDAPVGERRMQKVIAGNFELQLRPVSQTEMRARFLREKKIVEEMLLTFTSAASATIWLRGSATDPAEKD